MSERDRGRRLLLIIKSRNDEGEVTRTPTPLWPIVGGLGVVRGYASLAIVNLPHQASGHIWLKHGEAGIKALCLKFLPTLHSRRTCPQY